jgi:hypothetical protein
MKTPPLTIAEHVAFGNALKAAWHAKSEVEGKFPKSSRASKAACRLEKALLALKSALDDEVCRLVEREGDPRSLATSVYYGPPLVTDTKHVDAKDAFAGWGRRSA